MEETTVNLKVTMKRTLLSSALAAGLVLTPLSFLGTPNSVSAATAQTAAISVTVDGAKLALSPSPVTLKGNVLVPMRAIFKALHSSVTWEGGTKTILAVKAARRSRCRSAPSGPSGTAIRSRSRKRLSK